MSPYLYVALAGVGYASGRWALHRTLGYLLRRSAYGFEFPTEEAASARAEVDAWDEQEAAADRRARACRACWHFHPARALTTPPPHHALCRDHNSDQVLRYTGLVADFQRKWRSTQ